MALSFSVAPALGLLLKGGAAGYTDFCSQSFIAGSCIYAYDLNQRRVSSNAVPFKLTRISDSATLNGSYIGGTFSVNVSAVTAFCVGNGGTTTAQTYSTQYNDCTYTTIYNQTGMGCDLIAGAPYNLTSATAHAPLVQVRTSDGTLAIITPGTGIAGSPAVPYTSPAAKYLFSNGCTLADGGAARTLIGRGSNAFYGDVTHASGEYGRIETNPAPGNVPSGSAMNTEFFVSGGFSDYDTDIEGGALCVAGSPFSTSPTIDVTGVITYSSTAGGSNIWYNNSQTGPANCAPFTTVNTQDGIVIGCSGDYTLCNNNYFRGMAILNIDASLTAGLPSQIYNALR